MAVETLNCPMCGAPTSSDSPHCEHCGARLATVACPSCFGLIFQGAKFCSHCGAKVEQPEAVAAGKELCPRCRVEMSAVVVGTTNLRECTRCEGLWVDRASFDQICADREKQSAVLGMAAPVPAAEPGSELETIRYAPCPVCKQLMNRVNFANCSHVIVDICKRHGTWFDKDELRKIVEFIRAGGLDQARVRQIDELDRQKRELQASKSSGGFVDLPDTPAGAFFDDRHMGASIATSVIRSLFGF